MYFRHAEMILILLVVLVVSQVSKKMNNNIHMNMIANIAHS